jgi:general secretion pathway protein A
MNGDRPAPYNDPNFLAGLSDLDQDMDAGGPALSSMRGVVGPAPSAPAPSPVAPPLPLPPPVVEGGGRRRILDLFPPNEAPPPIFDALPAAPATDLPPAELAPPALAPPGAVPLPPPVPPPVVRPHSAMRSSALPSSASFYGLDELPFSPGIDARFLYQSDAYGRAAQQILGAIWRRERIVVLSGEPGIGKTMLCQSVIEQLDRRTLVSLVTDRFVSIDDLLRTVLVDLGVISASELAAGRLAQASHAELLGALRDFLVSIAPLQAFAVVILDGAEQLAPAALVEIAGLADVAGDDQLLQVILVGRPQLLATLARRELRPLAERVAVRCVLGPLAPDEVPGYVRQRLMTAGASPRVEFDDAALAHVHELSRGVPAAVNQLCDRALEAGVDRSSGVIDARAIEAAAHDLNLEPPMSAPMRLIRRAAMGLLLSLLVAAGAGAAALLFRADVEAFLSEWQNTPPAPAAPALPIPPPIDTVPAPPTYSGF